MRRAALVSLVAVPLYAATFAALPALGGGLKLPPRFAGKTESVSRYGVNISWELTVDEITPDGTVWGRMTYPGTVCGAKDAPFVGKFDGSKFTIDPVPFHIGNAMYCKGWVFPFSRKGYANRFEGVINVNTPSGYPMTLKITLEPQERHPHNTKAPLEAAFLDLVLF